MSELQFSIEDGYCRCISENLRPAIRELSIRLEPLHLTAAAIFLLQEAAKRQSLGKNYSEGSLFRYRSGAHLSQFLFKPGPWGTLEMVDLVVEGGQIVPGQAARAALTYFTQGCPHWDLGYGWPPKPMPLKAMPEMIPGSTSRAQVEELLGKPTRGDTRWLFADKVQPLYIDTSWRQDTLTSISGNHLSIQGLRLTPLVSADQLETRHKADLQRTFVAPPDNSLVRIEEVRVFSHPASSGHSLVLLSEFDADEKHRLSTLTWQTQVPAQVLKELGPSFGQQFMTGFCPSATPAPSRSSRALRLRSYMEASVHLVRQLVIAFGKPEWANEALSGLSLLVGAYLMETGVPQASDLQELELPPQIFLEAFEQLDSYLTRPETRVRFGSEAGEAGVRFEELAAFQWLLYNLTDGDLSAEEQRLARDLAQVFHQYRKTLQTMN